MKDKKFLRWLFTWTAIILAGYIAVSQIMNIFLDNEFEDQLINLTSECMYGDGSFSVDRYEVCVPDQELVAVKSLEQKNNRVYLVLENTKKEAGEVFIEIVDKELGYIADAAYIKVTMTGLLVDMVNSNFTNYRERQLCIVVTMIAQTILMWAGYFKSRRELRFSYHSIFCVGLGIWAAMVSVTMLIHYLDSDVMINFYSELAGAAPRFMFFTSPFILAFAVMLSVSNISLIRHEGFRLRNALGIVLSLVMLAGFALLLFVNNIYSSGYELYVKLWTALSEVLSTVYALLECFLIGAIICGTRAAKNKPAYDKDYIVILGSMIRPDGTLYPLIRGRADRAIGFYNEQLKASGKKAVFIPSGGKGADEPVSEAAAIRRYLLEQGIPGEQILTEERSENTKQNMLFSKELMEPGTKAVFSTTNFHVFRSGIIADQAGIEIDGMGSPTKWYFWPNAYIREAIGMLSYKWKALVILFIPIAAFFATVTLAF